MPYVRTTRNAGMVLFVRSEHARIAKSSGTVHVKKMPTTIRTIIRQYCKDLVRKHVRE